MYANKSRYMYLWNIIQLLNPGLEGSFYWYKRKKINNFNN